MEGGGGHVKRVACQFLCFRVTLVIMMEAVTEGGGVVHGAGLEANDAAAIVVVRR